MDGYSVTTTEGLRPADDSFHPLQERIARFNGSQCGFCTPGMVMTMFATLKKAECEGADGVTMEQMEKAFDGQLCRCTGYRPILDAAKSLAKDSDIEDFVCKDSPTGAYDRAVDPPFPDFLRGYTPSPLRFSSPAAAVNPITYARALSLDDALEEMSAAKGRGETSRVVVANTSVGIYKDAAASVLVDIGSINEMRQIKLTAAGLEVGAVASLANLEDALRSHAEALKATDEGSSFVPLADHVRRIANVHVRSVGSVGGNLVLASTRGFLSDLSTILLGAGATVTIAKKGARKSSMSLLGRGGGHKTELRSLPFADFLATFDAATAATEIVTSITIPRTRPGQHYRSYKAAIRPVNAHALVNAAFLAQVTPDGVVAEATLAFGGVGRTAVLAGATAAFLQGKELSTETVAGALEVLRGELVVEGERAKYRSNLVSGFFYKFMKSLQSNLEALKTAAAGAPSGAGAGVAAEAVESGPRGLTHGKQDLTQGAEGDPVGAPIVKIEAHRQAAGEAVYTDDQPEFPGTLYAAYVSSTRARAKITARDYAPALAAAGVVAVIDASNIPEGGKNDSAALPFDVELFFAEDEVVFHGQAVALVVAETLRQAEAAAELVQITYAEPDAPAILTLEAAIAANNVIPGVTNTFSRGDATANLPNATHRNSGTFTIGSQKHFYMETQSSYAVPDEDGCMVMYTANQHPTGVQATVAGALNLPQVKVRAQQRRAGGGFGGKITRQNTHACAVAVAAKALRRPVKLVLNRNVDMRMTGGRHDYRVEYDVGFESDGRITALHLNTALDGGIWADLSFFCNMAYGRGVDQGYFVPHMSSTATAYRTNTPTRTATRGPGEIQASYAIETVMEVVAHATGVPAQTVRELNMYTAPAEGEEETRDLGGSKLSHFTLPRVWSELKQTSQFEARVAAVEAFNAEHRWRKRGLSMTPVKYHVGQMSTGAIVNVYGDGSVQVTHGGSEIGQGINTKVVQVAASELGKLTGKPLDLSRISVSEYCTSRIPNMSMTGGSTTSEGSCAATRRCCQTIVARLAALEEGIKATKGVQDADGAGAGAGGSDELCWEDYTRAGSAFGQETDMQATSLFSGRDGGDYHNWGAALSEVELDVLTGETIIRQVDMLYDCGISLNPAVDVGQCEGAFTMGVGMMLREEHIVDGESGALLTDGTWEYKPPSAMCTPQQFNVAFLKDSPFPKGVLSSKASGEPPLVLAASVAMAARQAALAARKHMGADVSGVFPHMDTPNTVDMLQLACGVDAADAAQFEM